MISKPPSISGMIVSSLFTWMRRATRLQAAASTNLYGLVQNLEHELSVSLMDRTQIAYRDDNGMIDTMHMTGFRAALESGDLDENTTVFNNLIETKQDLTDDWEVPVSRSWHKQWLPVS